MSFLKATWDSICSIGKRSSTPRREDPTQDPPRGASASPTLPQYFDAWDDISWDILSETPLGETDESIDSPPPLYEDTMASIPSFSQEVRQALNSGSTTDLWLYSRKSPSPPLDDAEDHLSTISVPLVGGSSDQASGFLFKVTSATYGRREFRSIQWICDRMSVIGGRGCEIRLMYSPLRSVDGPALNLYFE
ncbi:hypothetical protein BU17DRAFT_65277 [Hysterangium stoloniferum]|nr:hypothetical protein BU17DRAFT_65277 [Hysterangium stoloniferum]